jgi:hypothetical protein
MSFRELLEAANNLGNYALRVDEQLTYLYINDDELKDALESYDLTDMENKILFVFGLKEDMGLTTFDAVQAQKGYGPIAYKVAMTIAGSLSPTQDSKVSKSAEKVWKEFYNGKGSKEVEIDSWGSNEEMMWKRSSYKLIKPLNLSKNKKAHETFIGKDPYNEKIDQLNELADSLLINTMRKIY